MMKKITTVIATSLIISTFVSCEPTTNESKETESKTTESISHETTEETETETVTEIETTTAPKGKMVRSYNIFGAANAVVTSYDSIKGTYSFYCLCGGCGDDYGSYGGQMDGQTIERTETVRCHNSSGRLYNGDQVAVIKATVGETWVEE